MSFVLAPSVAALPSATHAATAAGLQHRKLVDATQHFEGMLLQELMKPLQQHGFSMDGSGDDDDSKDSADTLSSYGIEAMAVAISKSGGLGIGKQVLAQVEGEARTRSSEHAAAVPK